MSEDKYFIKQADEIAGPWIKVDGFTGDKSYTTRTVSNGFTGSKQFFVAHEYEAINMGYAEIVAKTITVDANLSDWTETDIIATQDNFFDYDTFW